MAGGELAADGVPLLDQPGQKLTLAIFGTCLVAASCGLIFGYGVGVSGGLTAMESFLRAFFPDVLRRMEMAKTDAYCVFDSQELMAFTSSLYVAGLAASLAASHVTRSVGRQGIMLLGGTMFFAGAAVGAAAPNLPMVIVGRMLLGFGIGFTNQAAPVYLAEMAPPRWRGAFTAAFQFFVSVGILIANVINYAASLLPGWGWRLSLGLAAAPAAIIVLSAPFLSDSPTSLLLRGKPERARAALRRIRGPDADVDAEFQNAARAVETAHKSEDGAFRRIVRREYRPHLVMAVAVPLFQQVTGVILVAFYAPVLFLTVGFGTDAALLDAVILGAVSSGALFVSTLTVDRYGRRLLFFTGGAMMILCQVAVAWIMAAKMGWNGEATMPREYATAMVVLLCAYAAGYGWSWGPLCWIVPSEIFPAEIRSAGQGLSVAINLFVTFVQTQTFLAMMCCFKYATFIYFAGWVALMTAFVAAFLPETKGVTLEAMGSVWARHWYWSRFVKA